VRLGGPLFFPAFARIYALRGKRKEALAAPAKTPNLGPQFSGEALALVYFPLDDKDSGFAQLQHAIDSDEPMFFTCDPRFDSVRSDSGFQAMVAQVGLLK
jgi:hypothetical protein